MENLLLLDPKFSRLEVLLHSETRSFFLLLHFAVLCEEDIKPENVMVMKVTLH